MSLGLHPPVRPKDARCQICGNRDLGIKLRGIHENPPRRTALLITTALAAQQPPPGLDSKAIFELAKSATVVILRSEGAGRLQRVGTGVIISKDGIILTALHAIKGAAEVQVRMANGEVFDRVELLGSDERRDIAALKIAGRNVPVLLPASTAVVAAGDKVYAVTSANGLAWSATECILSAVRPADEIPGAGTGFRVLQFNAAIAPGSSGGGLVNRDGSLIGIITGSLGPSGFAVPIESVLGLSDSNRATPLGSGAFLRMPSQAGADAPKSSAAIADIDPKLLLTSAKTIHIHSRTAFLTTETLERALALQKDWPKLGLTIVRDNRLADLVIEIDRLIFTYVHTYAVFDRRSSIVLLAGKLTAIDGTVASGGIAKALVKLFLPNPAAKPDAK